MGGQPWRLAALALALALAGCGDGGNGGGRAVSPAARAPVGDKDAYCEVARRLDAQGRAAVASVKDAGGAADAYREFARDHLDDAQELQRRAPAEIRRDVMTVANGLRSVADGDTTTFEQSRFFAAAARVEAYEVRQCGIQPGGSWPGL